MVKFLIWGYTHKEEMLFEFSLCTLGSIIGCILAEWMRT